MKMRQKVVYDLIQFSNACNSQGWAKLKPEVQNSSWVFHTMTGIQILEPSLAASQGVYS